jgi:hypothetical protein
MSKSLIIVAAALLLFAGCESSSTNQPASYYQPADGRNLGPGLQDASHGDPQFPYDVDRGGGGGPR